MSLVVPWLIFPVVLTLLSLGCGLFLETAAGMRLSRPLLLPAGFAVIVVVSGLTTTNDTTARWTIPVVLGLAVVGVGLSQHRHSPRVDGWAAASALGTYAVFGAPVLLSGTATFAGYIKLDDTSSWLAITDRLMDHGRNLAGLPPSSYQAMLDYYLKTYGYPVGTFPPLGIGHVLLGTDSAWLFQPYLSFLAAMLALCLYGLARPLIESSRLRALAAFVSAHAALLYGYALWGGVKELATSTMFVLTAALTPTALRQVPPPRSLLPLATATAALFGLLSIGGGVWLAPLLLPVLVRGIRLHRQAFARVVMAFTAVVLVLSVPSLVTLRGFVKDLSLNSTGGDAGNLIHPLSWLQLFGIWPVGDFRLRPGNITATYILIAFLVAAAMAGIALAFRRRVWELPLYVAAAVLGCLITARGGSSWIDAKALAIASPAFLLAGMIGVAWVFRSGRRIEAAVLAAAIAGGVMWSNALAYHEVWLAPRKPLHELESIGKRFAGDGPTLTTDRETYGTRHFLRDMAAESPSQFRRHLIPLRNGEPLRNRQYADIDEFRLDGILFFRTLVLARSPSASRPPSPFSLVWRGRFYEVWQRTDPVAVHILEHLPLGGGDQAAGIPRCREVLRLADLAEASGGRLAAVPRPPATVVQLSRASRPPSWQPSSATPGAVYPSDVGTLQAHVAVSGNGRYEVWIGGSFRRTLEISIDGHRLTTGGRQIRAGEYSPLGDVELRSGSHDVVLRYTAASLSPGSGGAPFELGPLVLSRSTADVPVTYVRPSDAHSLCGKSIDWIEALGP
jgi:hypothetical protein